MSSYQLEIPQSNIKSIEEMQVGESGWTYPWALWRDEDGQLWVRESYHIHAVPAQDICVEVKKEADGFIVDASGTNFKWQTEMPSMSDKDISTMVFLVNRFSN